MSEFGWSLLTVLILAIWGYLGYNGFLDKKNPAKEKRLQKELYKRQKFSEWENKMEIKKEMSKQLEKKEYYNSGKLKSHFYFDESSWCEDFFSIDGNLLKKKEIKEWHGNNEYTLSIYDSQKVIIEEWKKNEIIKYSELILEKNILIKFDPITRKIIEKVNLNSNF
jgi:hypothetical protein